MLFDKKTKSVFYPLPVNKGKGVGLHRCMSGSKLLLAECLPQLSGTTLWELDLMWETLTITINYDNR